jgi:hypothetical protein
MNASIQKFPCWKFVQDPVTTEDSVKGMFKVIDNAGLEEDGLF